jgi:hypothetical protein
MSDRNEPRPIPDWVEQTPDTNTYTLVMYEVRGDAAQAIELERGEYIDLKRRLAEVRGHLTPKRARKIYRLIVETNCGPLAGRWERDVELTADEHNRLKQHLDKMRGHVPAEEVDHA